jgi:ATP-dependent helicase/nuclease subunit A
VSRAARDEANRAQREAADPAVSAFVAASAGSGKTKLLTDRLLRLMLNGADPARIQCLTFTKAAAAEMALRLQRRLGEWVTLDDAKLDAALRGLDVAATAATRGQARALFATVLDLPGGMRIGTIHAFCQGLLRRFPLEARLSPHFRLMDDPDAEVALAEAREAMLSGAFDAERRAALESLAGLVASLEGFGRLVEALRAEPERLRAALAQGQAGLAVRLRQVLGGREPGEVAAAIGGECDARALRRAAVALLAGGGSMAPKLGQGLSEWLGLDAATRAEHVDAWRGLLLTAAGEARTAQGLVRGKFFEQQPEALEALQAEQARLLALEDAGRAWTQAGLSAALAGLAAPVADAFAARKAATAMLDYADLIRASTRLLIDPGAAWVLYKLDGGLDHILLDEVQDTAPEQWEIAGRLTEEFFAGEGKERAGARTVFAVGDPKQSIYSFQGADPHAFGHWRGVLKRRVEAAGEQWRDVPLEVSFRSTTPVLRLVDAVFAAAPACEGVAAAGTLRHVADRAGHAGRVELWPLVPAPELPEPAPWSVPERNQASVGAMQRLADALAGWIAGQTGGGVRLESRGRALAPGDVLVLVRRRNAFARALVRALKARGVPVAGLDRLVLTEQPAVADLLALCDTLLLPEDDLSLACVLTSPLGGLDDDGLMALAAGRTGSLWSALRDRAGERAEWEAARAMIAALLARVDYASPHALLTEALGRLGLRARLFARLGPEAAEPVDELLGAALAYARGHPPSLQGFLHWLRQSGAEVKREAEGAGGAVRLMTVHGAKGLQAPLVILPDTTALPPEDGPVSWTEGLPVWTPRRELRCNAAEALRRARRQAVIEEHNRLLYVALTRAEDRLVVCGWSARRTPDEACWHRLVERGFERLGAAEVAFDAVEGGWEGPMRVFEAAQAVAPEADRGGGAVRAAVAPPGWAGMAPGWVPAPVPAEPALPMPLAPSRPEGVEAGQVPAAASPLAGRDGDRGRFRRGQVVHALLQHLPELEPASREAAALRYLAGPGMGAAVGDAGRLVAEVMAILAHPALVPLFGPGSRAEVPLTGLVAGIDGTRRVVGGLVDRLAVLPDRVLLADYKTNRVPPAGPEGAPVAYLRQMAAYREVLRGAFPGRRVVCALVWTVGAAVMPLPDSLLDGHVPGSFGAAA